jgi:hypothetical protein
VRADERLVLPRELGQVPPAADLDGRVAERQVVGVEQVGVGVEPEPPQGLGRGVLRMSRRDPDPGRHHPEPEPGQLRPEHVTPVPFGFGDREHRKQPAVGERRPLPPEDPGVPFAQDGQRLGGQLVPGGPAVPLRLQDAAPLQSGDGRTGGRLLDLEIGRAA